MTFELKTSSIAKRKPELLTNTKNEPKWRQTLCIPVSIRAVTRLLGYLLCDGEVHDIRSRHGGGSSGILFVRWFDSTQLETTINNLRFVNLILAMEGPSFLGLLSLVAIAL